MKKRVKCSMIIVIMLMVCMISTNSYSGTAVDTAINDGDKFIQNAKSTDSLIETNQLKNLSDDVFNMILAIGMVVAVAVGSALGIKFMISSVEEKAKIKQILIVYVIGCIVLFGAYTIWRIVTRVLSGI